MEYGLWPVSFNENCAGQVVLILVLMEYGLWLFKEQRSKIKPLVLILVLMEYGLWLKRAEGLARVITS